MIMIFRSDHHLIHQNDQLSDHHLSDPYNPPLSKDVRFRVCSSSAQLNFPKKDPFQLNSAPCDLGSVQFTRQVLIFAFPNFESFILQGRELIKNFEYLVFWKEIVVPFQMMYHPSS